ncbi:esterase family protein [Aldersonia sp. NBC_00410]|uniref:alpha/beta hydrolase n=1 Tax=Aldersonia sp. NBC_00410 TaxID=2975954 RepID=UPI00224D3087|nr:alpha/beta hydrolase-fold protein [Aldersonia sp. NBC_00410]MCX5044376.1 esterase family protein [Aldersonia sp. NBC_00410]
METITDISLLSGALPTVVLAIGALGAVWLLVAQRRWYYYLALPACLIGATLVTLLAYQIVENWWRPFPDPVETEVYVWIGVAIAAIALLVPRILTARHWPGRVLTVVAVLAVVLAASSQINRVFAYYPTLRTALGMSNAHEVDFAAVPGPTATTVTGRPLDSVWQAPAGMPSTGDVTSVSIPGDKSGFAARPARVYLPPAYLTDPRALLPVLVMMAGQPGEPDDWIKSGGLATTMNDFAAAHDGLAPVVVVADGTGSTLANPLCMDSRLGNVDTYLAVDVPNWVKAHLQVDPNPRSWAVGGLSYGGTCALQLATNHPDVYPTFLDFSGQVEPTLGDRQRTVDAAFGGDDAAFRKVNPLDLLTARDFSGSAGMFVVGAGDDEYRDGQRKMAAAAKGAGMEVVYLEVPGGHSFAVWTAALRASMDWLAKRLGLIP